MFLYRLEILTANLFNLFPDLNPEGIVIPIGHGTGLIQVIDNEHPYQVLPLLCPTYYTTEGIH